MEFPYKQARRGQIEACRRIAKHLGSKIVLKAPTGFGKTIVALISHVNADKVIYAVRTINEMSPVIRELRRAGLSYTFIFSASKMCPIAQDIRVGEPEDFWAGCKALRVRGLCPYYYGIESALDRVRAILKESGTSDPKTIASLIAFKAGVCPFFSLSKLINESKFTIVTYPYVFREEVFETAFTDLGPDNFHLILDEAHTLLIPQSVIDESIDEVIIEKALKEVKQYGCGEEVWKYLNEVKELILKQRSRLLKRVDKELLFPGEGLLTILEDALYDIRLKKLLKMVEPTEAVSLSTKMSKVVKFVRYLGEEDFKAYGHVRDDGVREVKALPLGYSFIIKRLEMFKGVLMMSGTMPPPRILKPICGPNLTYIDVEEEYGRVFPRSNISYLVITEVTSSYRSRCSEMYGKYALLITRVYESMPKGVLLAVYPSYSFMGEVVKNIVVTEGRQFEESRETKYDDLLKAARAGEKVIVHCVAGGKISEGLEVLDELGRSLIKVVVIAGIPYPKPDDYARDFEGVMKELVNGEAREYTMELPAVIKVMQAAGRAIRSERDEAVIVLGDRRFMIPKVRELLNVRYDAVIKNVNEVGRYVERFFKGLI